MEASCIRAHLSTDPATDWRGGALPPARTNAGAQAGLRLGHGGTRGRGRVGSAARGPLLHGLVGACRAGGATSADVLRTQPRKEVADPLPASMLLSTALGTPENATLDWFLAASGFCTRLGLDEGSGGQGGGETTATSWCAFAPLVTGSRIPASRTRAWPCDP